MFNPHYLINNMDKITLYQEMLIEAMKRRINAVADEQNALKNLFDAKINYMWEHIGMKMFNINGLMYLPAKIKWYKSSFEPPYTIDAVFLCEPSELLKCEILTDTERKRIRDYEKNVFNEFTFDVYLSHANEVLLDKVQRNYYWELHNCRNKVSLYESRVWRYDLSEISSSGFVSNRMMIGDTFLW